MGRVDESWGNNGMGASAPPAPSPRTNTGHEGGGRGDPEKEVGTQQQQQLEEEQNEERDSFNVMLMVQQRANFNSNHVVDDKEHEVNGKTDESSGQAEEGSPSASTTTTRSTNNATAGAWFSELRREGTKEEEEEEQQQQQQQQSFQQQGRESLNMMSLQQQQQPGRESLNQSFNIMALVQERADAANMTTSSSHSRGMTVNQLQESLNEEVMPLPPPLQQPPSQGPGAYSNIPGRQVMRRISDLRFSLVGSTATSAIPENEISTIEEGINIPATTTSTPPSPVDDNGTSTNNYNNNNNEEFMETVPVDDEEEEELMEAMPVQSEQFRPSSMMDAHPIDQQNLDQKEAKFKKYKRLKRFGFGFVIISVLVITVSLAIRFSSNNNNNNGKKSTLAAADKEDIVVVDTDAPTPSPTRPLPPMENLETMYSELPEKTKESLYNTESYQYQAWEWLLRNPSITTYPEWRKKQIFAMVTFFYSFGGPDWPKRNRDKWLNVTTSECSWVLDDDAVAYMTYQSINYFGPDTYGQKDWQPCNEDGKLQLLFATDFDLMTTTTTTTTTNTNAIPSIPKEIELLTSLRFLVITYCRIGTKLTKLLVPELIQLPKLQLLNLHSSGISGTIPEDIGLMTGLRQLVLGENKLTGSIPTEIAMMTSLEHFILGDMTGDPSKLPSELGLLTRLTGLMTYQSSFTGLIPTELGSLSRMRVLEMFGNHLSGSIPSEIATMTGMVSMHLEDNKLSGAIPSELGLMTNIKILGLANYDPGPLGVGAGAHENNFTGPIPKELWEVPHMEELYLHNLPHLSGSVPKEMIMPNLTVLTLTGTQVSGTIPDQACLFIEELHFDCSDLLCGCDCQCA